MFSKHTITAAVLLALTGTAQAAGQTDGSIFLVCKGTNTVQKNGNITGQTKWEGTITVNLNQGWIVGISGKGPIVANTPAFIGWQDPKDASRGGHLDRISGNYIEAYGTQQFNFLEGICTKKNPLF